MTARHSARPTRSPARPLAPRPPRVPEPPRSRRAPVLLIAVGVLLATATVLAFFTVGSPGTAPAQAAPARIAPVQTAAPPAPAVVTPAEQARCPVASTACVDLAARKAWLQEDGKVLDGPVPMLPGAETFLRPPGPTSSATPTGTFRVLWKDADAVSSEFDEPMNHAVYFAPGGIAFHEGSLTTSSNGCIHLSAAAATTFFDRLRPGDGVTVF